MSLVNQERLKQLIEYNPSDGVFTRKIQRHKHMAGEAAGTLHPFGYIHIRIDGRSYKAHRLAWFYVHGVWPEGDIDHIDRNRSNNCIANLQDVSRKENMENASPHSKNKSGFKGVSWKFQCKRWQAQITHNRKKIYLGVFKTAQEAHLAYEKAAKQFFTNYQGV
jgi:hypothetical protein